MKRPDYESMLSRLGGDNKTNFFEDTKNKTVDLMNDEKKRKEVLKRIRLESGKRRPSIDDFYSYSEIYSKDEIDKDKASILELDEIFAEQYESNAEREEFAEIYEYVITHQLNMWFKAGLFEQASIYDDLKNGIDAYGMFKSKDSKNSYIGLGIDVKFGSDTGLLEKKIKSIEAVLNNKVGDRRLPEIKYFIDRNGDHRKVNVPKIIFGTTLGSAQLLISLAQSTSAGDKHALQHSIDQYKLIVQANYQLEYFVHYARSKKNEEAAKAYSEMLNIFQSLYSENESKILEYKAEIDNDEIVEYIKQRTIDKVPSKL